LGRLCRLLGLLLWLLLRWLCRLLLLLSRLRRPWLLLLRFPWLRGGPLRRLRLRPRGRLLLLLGESG
jgi:hypothetical protein